MKKYYQKGFDQIIQGDANVVLGTLPDNTFDLTITSPPYDALRTYKGFLINFSILFKHILRITKLGGIFVWVIGDQTVKGNETGTSFKQALQIKAVGFNLHDTMIYKKRGSSTPAPLSSKRYFQEFEYMFVFSKGKPNTFNGLRQPRTTKGDRIFTKRQANGTLKIRNIKMTDTRLQGNVWEIDAGYMRSTKYKPAYQHPAIFPEQLIEKHILTWTNEGDIVLDPMVGSGTTAIVAKKLKRHFIGIDIAGTYCKLTQERLNENN